MAKLIKKGTNEVQDTSREHELSEFNEVSRITDTRRPGIIDRDTYEARAVGQQIRDRAQAQADEILAKAEEQAQELLQRAAMEAEQLKTQAHAQGYREGKERGVSELTEVVTRTSIRLQETEDQLLPQLSTLATSIARKILGKELEFHPEAVVQIVKHALGEKARQRREISLRVHPDDMIMIREHKGELLEILSRTKEIAIREDPEVQRHGVIIETDAGTIDAQLDTQLAVFERVLEDVR